MSSVHTAVVPGYNERAWAIDVISEINAYCSTTRLAVLRAGGEHTVKGADGKSLFPDVLLFGDATGTVVQQGWELKMPDTPVTDAELLENAEKKARRLSLNSFVVWNANEAVLFLKDEAGDSFVSAKSWTGVGFTDRSEVRAGRHKWVGRLHEILVEVNGLLTAGTLRGATPALVLDEDLFVGFLSTYTESLATHLKTSYRRSASFAAEIDDWWSSHEIEHPGSDKESSLAKVNLVNWINRFLFAHYLKQFNAAARPVESIVPGTTVADALSIFESISFQCDFMNVFRLSPGQAQMDAASWGALVSLNGLLVDFRLESLDQRVFQKVLDSALAYSRKKMAGQFATPKLLAELLVRLTVEDREAPVIDPCCGTGTIARAVYDLKREVGQSVHDSLATTWGSDKYAFPLQLCSIALSDPLGMGDVVQVFKRDAFSLHPDQLIKFTDPNGGCEVERALPAFHAVVSNLPFVRFENSAAANEALSAVNRSLGADSGGVSLSSKGDLYSYLIFALRNLLAEGGRVGVVVSNAWMASDWGIPFKDALHKHFRIKWVVVSGAGRWFSNAKVVTTLLVLEKRTHAPADGDCVTFVSTKFPLLMWEGHEHGPATIAREVILGRANTETTLQTYSWKDLRDLQGVGLGWPAMFSDVSGFSRVAASLVPVSTRFDIARGERRGWDPLFYPEGHHTIESQYIARVLKSARSIDGLVASPDGAAFCCSSDEAALAAAGATGTLDWIARFKLARNGTGKLLPDVLAVGGNRWYEMKPNTLADLVISMNPDRRLGIHRLAERAFVNQRLIRLTAKVAGEDTALSHALMNSTVGLFLLEAAGFGRGEGVLDLNAGKLARSYHMLNPTSVSASHRQAILDAFLPLLSRSLMDLEREMACPNRLQFDERVMHAYGLDVAVLESVRQSLLTIYRIRQAARDGR